MKNLCVLFCMSLFLASCSSDVVEEKIETYLVANPILKDTNYVNEYVADIQALQNVEIRSRIVGFIEKQHVDEGSLVHKGQLLFTLTSNLHQHTLQAAKSALRNAIAESKSAQIELENTVRLMEKNIVSQTETELMRSKLEAKNAKVEEMDSEVSEAQRYLSFTQIRAPFDGIINRIPNKPGSLLDEGTLLTSISNNSHMLVYFNVSEEVYLDFISSKTNHKEKTISMMMANDEMYPYKGSIETIESEFDKSTGNIAFRAKFPNPSHLLKHGSSGKILIESKLKNAVIIPQKSTFEIQDYTYVFVVDDQNIVHQKRIIPKFRMQNLFVVGSGISAKDRFVVEGVQLVKDGEKINPQTISSSEVLASLPK